MRRLPLPLTLSAAGHLLGIGAFVALTAWFPPAMLPRPASPAPVEVVFLAPPAPPVAESTPPPAEPPPAPTPPPPPPPVAAATPVPAPVHVPPPRPIARPKPAPVQREPEPAWEPPPSYAHQPGPPAPVYRPPAQVAALPPTAPPASGPAISAGYRAALAAWLEAHKRYPESARQRGEQGRATLRFQVERDGRVISFALVKGTGYPDLDAAIDEMMRGARLPPFPPDIASASIDVSVTVNFALTR
jgi:protein TonB